MNQSRIAMTDSDPQILSAYTPRLIRGRFSRWLEIGTGKMGSDGVMVFHASLDRLPIGGFSGEVYFVPLGTEPPILGPPRPSASLEIDEH
jgi:hypothetical protein